MMHRPSDTTCNNFLAGDARRCQFLRPWRSHPQFLDLGYIEDDIWRQFYKNGLTVAAVFVLISARMNYLRTTPRARFRCHFFFRWCERVDSSDEDSLGFNFSLLLMSDYFFLFFFLFTVYFTCDDVTARSLLNNNKKAPLTADDKISSWHHSISAVILFFFLLFPDILWIIFSYIFPALRI